MSARSLYLFSGRVLLTCAPFAIAVCLGCNQQEQIQSYTVAKETPDNPVPAGATSDPAAASDRMLAAILPAGEQAWFFKAVGPSAAIDQQAQAITEFFTNLRLDGTGRARWELPSGWKEDPASGMRAATLWIPADGKPIEISVTKLPWSDTPDDVLSNVNRWRSQMALAPVGQNGLAECTRELKAGDVKITLADLRGKFQTSGMMGPFAGGAAAASSALQNGSAKMPADHPPIDANSPPRAAAASAQLSASLPTFEVPQSWQQQPPTNAMRKAEFRVADGAQQAVVTLSDFPTSAGPNIASPLPNVNRWRREIGLGEITPDALGGVTEAMEIGGQPATFVRLVPDSQTPESSQSAEATLAAMVTSGDVIWFIKMKGARSLVAAQEDQFKTFLKSIHFPAAGGVNHGNQ